MIAYAGLVDIFAPFKYISARQVLIFPPFSTPYSVGSVSIRVSEVVEAIDKACCLGIVVDVIVLLSMDFYIILFKSIF